MNKNTVLGLDLGVASIGWGLLALDENDIPTSILDHGVVTYKAVDNDKGKILNEDRRNYRGSRRVTRRRKERLRRIKNLLKTQFNLTNEDYERFFHGVDVLQNNDVYNLKLKGLESELTNEELSRILIHYAKHRGFKSNRKSADDGEKGKMKSAIGDVQNIMKRDNVTVTKAVLTLKEEKGLAVLHNTGELYSYGFERSDVEEEIIKILNKQAEYNLIDETFGQKYLEVWGSQRDFSEGPACGPYKVDFEKMFGICTFTNEKRASRACPSYELNVLLQKLLNLKYYIIDENGLRTKEDGKRPTKYSITNTMLKNLYNRAIESGSLKYSTIEKEIKSNNSQINIEFVDLPTLSKKEFNELLVKYKKDKNITDRNLNDNEYLALKKVISSKVLEKELTILKSYKTLKDQIKKHTKEKKYYDIKWIDKVATILSYAKTDNAVEKTINEKYSNEFNKDEIELIKKLEVKVSGTGSLSLKLLQSLNELHLEGVSYTDAMVKLGYNHALPKDGAMFTNGFPTIKEIEDKYDTVITQVNVKRTLVYLRKLYNKIVETYGVPKYVNIEVARDIRNSYSERLKLRENQINNQTENEKAKMLMRETLGIKDIEHKKFKSFSGHDILKFRLWNEQNGICLYTGEEIDIKHLLGYNAFEVDHILPFSRTFDDSFNNKVLVSKRANQEKKNRTPFEWLGRNKTEWNQFVENVKNSKVNDAKKNNLLLTEDISYDEFSNRSLSATSYVNVLATKIFKDLLNTEENNYCVRTFKGTATSYLRKYFKLNNLTHSLEDKDYDRSNIIFEIKEQDLVIKRDKSGATIEISAKNEFGVTYSAKHTIKIEKDKYNSQDDLYIISKIDDLDRIVNLAKDTILNTNIFKIEDYDIFRDEIRNNEFAFVFSSIFFNLLSNIKGQINAKNRSNHFHHEVDAILVASMTRSMQMKITKFHQLWQDMEKSSNKNVVNNDSGEVYTAEDLKRDFNIDKHEKNSKFYIPLPYPNFVEELKIKVFEKDQEILSDKLSMLGMEDARVKWPSYQVNTKVSGSLHADTIYGKRLSDGIEVSVKKEAVDKITNKNIDKIYDKDSTQKAVYEAVSNWLKNGKKTNYPLMKNNQPIKTVKLIGSEIDKMVRISNNTEQRGYAGIGEVARIQIYEKEGSDKLHFVQISVEQYLKIKAKQYNFNVTAWYGQGKNKEIVCYKDLLNKGYKLKQTLYPGQHISMLMKSSVKVDCRVVGFGSGMFEIKSITGDDYDLISRRLTEQIKDRNQVTVSTIKSITPIYIDILGNLNVI